MSAAGVAALPTEVTAARREVERALAEAGAPVPPAGPGAGPPSAALVGAPGRGRRALAAALVDLPPDAVGPSVARLAAAAGPGVLAVAVPLLDELVLDLPARAPDGGWGVGPEASALLVVVGAGAPLDAAELDALTTAAATVETAVFALVGTEAHRGWRTVLEADRELVAERVPRWAGAPWFPVSPVLAARARGTGADGEPLRRHAGTAPLQRHLQALLVRRRRMLDEANALRAGASALAALPAPVVVSTDALRARRAALETARLSWRREHHVRWRAELAAARLAVLDDLARRLRALGTRHRDALDTATTADLAALADAVAVEVAEEARAVVADLGERLRALVVGTLATLLPPEELAALRIPPPEARPDLPVPTPRRPDRLLVVAGASGGLGLSRLALLPLLAVPVAPVVGAALVPVSVGIGLGAAGWLARSRRRAADRAHARAWLAEALAQARADLERVLSEALIAADREITLALDRALDQRSQEVDAALRALGEQVRRDADARAREAARAERARRAVVRADAVLARLAAARDRT
ncbi:dynamin [Actinomycetospora sp. TBRC 11914]|uniref:dynamin n=1 Tax=Actinomycetospora sp. TBRC 11914 TaxID=2729387 RepID=UPI00145CB245|nr:dynamin [Actinomycetospora sp. TBRC 11914]NMO92029.1 dynamin [Actinomycetospora sp. TBRC 11914]